MEERGIKIIQLAVYILAAVMVLIGMLQFVWNVAETEQYTWDGVVDLDEESWVRYYWECAWSSLSLWAIPGLLLVICNLAWSNHRLKRKLASRK